MYHSYNYTNDISDELQSDNAIVGSVSTATTSGTDLAKIGDGTLLLGSSADINLVGAVKGIIDLDNDVDVVQLDAEVSRIDHTVGSYNTAAPANRTFTNMTFTDAGLVETPGTALLPYVKRLKLDIDDIDDNVGYSDIDTWGSIATNDRSIGKLVESHTTKIATNLSKANNNTTSITSNATNIGYTEVPSSIWNVVTGDDETNSLGLLGKYNYNKGKTNANNTALLALDVDTISRYSVISL